MEGPPLAIAVDSNAVLHFGCSFIFVPVHLIASERFERGGGTITPAEVTLVLDVV